MGKRRRVSRGKHKQLGVTACVCRTTKAESAGDGRCKRRGEVQVFCDSCFSKLVIQLTLETTAVNLEGTLVIFGSS